MRLPKGKYQPLELPENAFARWKMEPEFQDLAQPGFPDLPDPYSWTPNFSILQNTEPYASNHVQHQLTTLRHFSVELNEDHSSRWFDDIHGSSFHSSTYETSEIPNCSTAISPTTSIQSYTLGGYSSCGSYHSLGEDHLFGEDHALDKDHSLEEDHSHGEDRRHRKDDTPEDLHSHGKDATNGSKIFVREICGESFERNCDRNKHFNRKHNARFECGQCGRKFYLQNDKYRHEMTHNPSRSKFKCHACEKSFYRLDSLERHAKSRCHNRLQAGS